MSEKLPLAQKLGRKHGRELAKILTHLIKRGDFDEQAFDVHYEEGVQEELHKAGL